MIIVNTVNMQMMMRMTMIKKKYLSFVQVVFISDRVGDDVIYD